MDPENEMIMAELNEPERKVFSIIRMNSEISINMISRESGMHVADVNSIVAQLEINGFVVSSMGTVYIAK